MAPHSLAGTRILLLEDEPLIAMEVEDLCREHGAQTIIVHHALEEAQSIQLPTFDLAIVDLILRGQSALPLAEKLHAASVPLVFTTGGDGDGQLETRFAGVPLVKKPYTGSELISAIVSARRKRLSGV